MQYPGVFSLIGMSSNNKKKMKITSYLFFAASALAISACNSDSDTAVAYYTDIVTLDASSASGSVMTYQDKDDSPLVTLTSTTPLSEEHIGKRIVILYSPVGTTEHGVSANINLVNAGLTYGAGEAPLDAVVDTLDSWSSDPVTYIQAYRSGKYLNLGMILPTNATPEKLRCYVDITTLDSEYPELHFVYKAKVGYDSESANFFGSYDISNIWNRPEVKGFKLFYNDNDNDSGSVTIEKASVQHL